MVDAHFIIETWNGGHSFCYTDTSNSFLCFFFSTSSLPNTRCRIRPSWTPKQTYSITNKATPVFRVRGYGIQVLTLNHSRVFNPPLAQHDTELPTRFPARATHTSYMNTTTPSMPPSNPVVGRKGQAYHLHRKFSICAASLAPTPHDETT
jgi:hypothetical protein